MRKISFVTRRTPRKFIVLTLREHRGSRAIGEIQKDPNPLLKAKLEIHSFSSIATAILCGLNTSLLRCIHRILRALSEKNYEWSSFLDHRDRREDFDILTLREHRGSRAIGEIAKDLNPLLKAKLEIHSFSSIATAILCGLNTSLLRCIHRILRALSEKNYEWSSFLDHRDRREDFDILTLREHRGSRAIGEIAKDPNSLVKGKLSNQSFSLLPIITSADTRYNHDTYSISQRLLFNT